jgi:hypothetical protein
MTSTTAACREANSQPLSIWGWLYIVSNLSGGARIHRWKIIEVETGIIPSTRGIPEPPAMAVSQRSAGRAVQGTAICRRPFLPYGRQGCLFGFLTEPPERSCTISITWTSVKRSVRNLNNTFD